eukprot:gene7446-28734_t
MDCEKYEASITMKATGKSVFPPSSRTTPATTTTTSPATTTTTSPAQRPAEAGSLPTYMYGIIAGGALGLLVFVLFLVHANVMSRISSLFQLSNQLAAACIPQPAACIPRPAACILQPAACILRPAACIPRPAACIPQPWKRTRTATWCLKLRAHRPCSKGNDTIAIAKLAHCEAAGNNAIICDNNKCDSTLTSVVDTNSGTVAGQEAQMKEITAVAKMLRYD